MKPTARCPDCAALVVRCETGDGVVVYVDPKPDPDGTVITAGLPRVTVFDSPDDIPRSEAFVYRHHRHPS